MRWKSTEYRGWGRVRSATGDVARPERSRALDEVLAEATGPAIGMGRSYGDAGLNSGGRAIDMTRLDRMLGFDPATGVLEVEAGARIGDIARAFAPRRWLPAVMPGTGFATVGGCIAMDVHGKNHHHIGSFCQHVTEITLRQGAKTLTITPETKGNLFRATAGGLGQTGVIATAKLRLIPCTSDMILVTERRVASWDDHIAALDASEASYAVGWIDATASGASLGRGIVEEGEPGKGLVRPRRAAWSVPFNAPGFALSGPVVRAFNRLYYGRVPASGRTLVKPIDDFFFPLDRIGDWNRLYGKRGFHQFQCVVPEASVPVLQEMLAMIAASGLASPLAVLKRMGAGRAGYLSFPMAGYTLAVDFPNRGAVGKLVPRLARKAAQAGGRIYFAKDSLAPAELMPVMYPELKAWASEVAKADPEGALTTDLVRRLNLREAGR